MCEDRAGVRSEKNEDRAGVKIEQSKEQGEDRAGTITHAKYI